MKFEEVLPALRKGKKVTSNILGDHKLSANTEMACFVLEDNSGNFTEEIYELSFDDIFNDSWEIVND